MNNKSLTKKSNKKWDILLIGFNRSDLILNNIKLLQTKNNLNLWIAVDGPRKENKKDQKEYKLIKKYCKKYKIESKYTKFNPTNKGCRNGVNDAISWFFSKVEYGIIIEDDVEINLDYINQIFSWLDIYKDDKSICSISSHCSIKAPRELVFKNGNCLLPTCRVWGWATWRDRWQDHMNTTLRIKRYSVNRLFFLFPLKYRDFHCALKIWYCLNNKFDTWDYEWNFYHIINNKKSITPDRFYSINNGYRKDATHTNIKTAKPKYKMSTFKINKEADNNLNQIVDFSLLEISTFECGFPIQKNHILEISRLIKYNIKFFIKFLKRKLS